MKNDSEMLRNLELDNDEALDFDELEAKLQGELDSQLGDLDFLKDDRKKIGDPDSLGKTVMNAVWEQFINQIAVTAGEDFIKENNGLTLDLSNDAHIQTTENFANGNIASHNTKIDYQERYDNWQSNFQKDENGNIKINPTTGQATLSSEARRQFDENRDKGSAAVHKDHTIPVAEILRDPAANAHLDKSEQIEFANGAINLQDMDAAANMSKGDKSMNDALKSERDGKKFAERFNVDEDELRKRDEAARDEYEKLKAEGEKKSIEAGKQSQRKEAFRIGGTALRAVVMQLLAELIKTMIGKLIQWFKSANKSINTLLESFRQAIITFVSNLKRHLVNAADTIITTVATAIFGPVMRTIKRVFTLLKQGWRSLQEAIAYLKNPENRTKPFSILMLEVGKIVTVGLSAVGAIALGEVIEKGLMAIPGAGPVFAFEIPLLGSLGSLLGIFLGGLVAGIIGAIAMNLIDKAIAKKKRAEAVKKEITKGNEIINTQNSLIALHENKLVQTKNDVADSISERHNEAANIIKEAFSNVFDESKKVKIDTSDNDESLSEINKKLLSLGV